MRNTQSTKGQFGLYLSSVIHGLTGQNRVLFSWLREIGGLEPIVKSSGHVAVTYGDVVGT